MEPSVAEGNKMELLQKFASEMAEKFPTTADADVPYLKIARKFMENFSQTESLPGGFVQWERERGNSKFYDVILRYWTIETIIRVASDMMREEAPVYQEEKKENGENVPQRTLGGRMTYFDLIGEWAVWAENDPQVTDWQTFKREIETGKITDERWHIIYKNVDDSAAIMKKNRNADLRNNVDFDLRRSKNYRSEPSVIACNQVDYIINHFFRSMWAILERQQQGKSAQGKVWRKEVAHKILKGCGCPLSEEEIINLYARIKDEKRGKEENHLRRSISMPDKEYIKMMRFCLAIALYYSPYTTYERFIIQHQEYVGGWESRRKCLDGDGFETIQYYVPIYFYEKYGKIVQNNLGQALIISEWKQLGITAYFDDWYLKLINFWIFYFDSLHVPMSPHEILCSLNALQLPRSDIEEPLWPVELRGGYPLHR